MSTTDLMANSLVDVSERPVGRFQELTHVGNSSLNSAAPLVAQNRYPSAETSRYRPDPGDFGTSR